MSISREQFFADLDALEREVPTLERDSLEERMWKDRVIQFCQYANSFFPIPKELSTIFAKTLTEEYKHPGLWSERDVVVPYPGEKALEEDITNHQREGRKEFFIRYRDFLETRFKYSDVHPQEKATIKGCFYWSNGGIANLQINGRNFPLNDSTQQRGKNAAAHLADLLYFPGRIPLVTEEDFKNRIIAAGEQYSTSTKSNTFKEAIRRINNLVGKTPSGKEFLVVTLNGCKINDAFVAEFNPQPVQV